MITTGHRNPLVFALLLMAGTALATTPISEMSTENDGSLRAETFDIEPATWEGINNRGILFGTKTVRQDFGYSSLSRHASAEPGEVGGTINPAAEKAYYAYRL